MLNWTESVPGTRLTLTGYTADVLREAHGFGGFLFDTKGHVVEEDGWVWLYTAVLIDDRWESWARRFHFESMTWEPARLVLLPQGNRDRAVLHHVVAVADDFIVGFFCDGKGVSVAVAASPGGDFIYDESFALDPETGWETRDQPNDGWSLESNGGFILCSEDENSLIFWQGYDSYKKDGGLGDLGWVKIEIDKIGRHVSLLERHPENPIKFRQPGWLCARCGGNLDNRLSIDGRHAFFFYIRPAREDLRIGLALSSDPFFFENVTVEPFDTLFGDEKVAEKFEAIVSGDQLYLFYESMMNDQTWHTGVRIYRMN